MLPIIQDGENRDAATSKGEVQEGREDVPILGERKRL
jgi:hypothetical protein